MHLSQKGDTTAQSSGFTLLTRLAFDMKHLGKPRSELRNLYFVLQAGPLLRTQGRGFEDASKAVDLDILSNIGIVCVIGIWNIGTGKDNKGNREKGSERERESEREKEREMVSAAFASQASLWSTQ